MGSSFDAAAQLRSLPSSPYEGAKSHSVGHIGHAAPFEASPSTRDRRGHMTDRQSLRGSEIFSVGFGVGPPQMVIWQGSEVTPEERRYQRADDDPDDSGQQPAAEHTRPIDFALSQTRQSL